MAQYLNGNNEWTFFLDSLLELPFKEIPEYINCIIYLLNGIGNYLAERERFLINLNKLPVTERGVITAELAKSLRTPEMLEYTSDFIRAIEKVPVDDVPSVIKRLLEFIAWEYQHIQRGSCGEQAEYILEAVSEVDPAQRLKFLQIVSPHLLVTDLEEMQRYYLLIIFQGQETDHLETTIQDTVAKIKRRPVYYEYWFPDTLDSTPIRKRVSVIKAFAKIFENCASQKTSTQMATLIGNFSFPQERVEAIEQASTLETDQQRIIFLHALHYISPPFRSAALELVTPEVTSFEELLAEFYSHDAHIEGNLGYLGNKFRHHPLEGAITLTLKFAEKKIKDGLYSHFLEILLNLLFSNSPPPNHQVFLKGALEGIPNDQRLEFYRFIFKVLERTFYENKTERNSFLLTLAMISPEDRLEVMRYAERVGSPVPKLRYILTFPYVAPQFRETLVTFANMSHAINSEEQFFIEFFRNNEILSESQAHLKRTLEGIRDSARARSYSTSVHHAAKLLKIREGNPLYEMAVQVRCTSEAKGAKNPYLLYSNLRNQLQVEPLTSLNFPLAQMEGMEGDTISIILNLEKLRASRKPLKFKDLPVIDRNFFHSIFDRLEGRVLARIDALQQDPSQHGEMKKIEELQSEINAHRSNLFNKPYIQHLLDLTAAPDDFVEYPALHLFTAIQYLQSKDPNVHQDIKDGQFLSDQDQELLTFCFFLEKCSIGQQDGLSAYHNNLVLLGHANREEEAPLEVVTVEAIENRRRIKKAEELARESLLGWIQLQLASQEFLQGLAKTEKLVPQGSHQTLYLKNRLHLQLGLDHTLTFDLSTECILDQFIGTTTEDLLKFLFYRTPRSKMIKQFQERVNRELLKKENGSLTYQDCYELINDFDNREGIGSSCFTQEEDAFVLTELGAAYLFLSTDYGILLSQENSHKRRKVDA